MLVRNGPTLIAIVNLILQVMTKSPDLVLPQLQVLQFLLTKHTVTLNQNFLPI